MRSNAMSRLDRVLTCLAGLALVTAMIATVSATRKAAMARADYEIGDAFAEIVGLDTSRSPLAVAFISAQCEHCQEVGDTLRQITSAPRQYQVVVVGYEDVAALQQFVHRFSIRADAVLHAPVNSIRFSGVPKVAILDRRNVVRFIWSGSGQIKTSLHDILGSAQAVGRQKASRWGLW